MATQVTVLDQFELKGERTQLEVEEPLGSFTAVLLVDGMTGPEAKQKIENYDPLLAKCNALSAIVQDYEEAARMIDEGTRRMQASRADGRANLP